jgi:hypothetical protein
MRHVIGMVGVAIYLLWGWADPGSDPIIHHGPPAMAYDKRSPIYGVTIPPGYRKWQLVAPSREAGNLDELRAIVGNGVVIKTYGEATLPFPDGAIFVKLAWKQVASNEADGAFIPGRATTVQVMVKDSRKYTSTGGWGFGRFVDGKPVDESQHKTCFACHAQKVKGHDFVFTRYSP